MVFLAITPAGLAQALRSNDGGAITFWCGSDAISGADYAALAPASVSRFTYPLWDRQAEVLARAIETIGEHHPEATVWVERVHEPRLSGGLTASRNTFDTLPLHDATLHGVHFEWAVGRCTLHVTTTHLGQRSLVFSGVTELHIPKDQPWGPSASINAVCERMTGSFEI